jgi:sialic acid synthase SpsE
MQTIRIADHRIGGGRPAFIIAEIGTAHGGDVNKARLLAEAAARAGADCVKTQVVFADEIVHPRCGAIDLPGGKISIYDRFRELEAGIDFYGAIKKLTEACGLVFLASAFGVRSAAILHHLDVPAYKIASPEVNHFPLLDAVGRYGKPVILSGGVARLPDIEEALARLPRETALLHCVTAYPAPEEEYNLRLIPLLSRLFDVPVGVSDHSRDPALVPAAAVTQGACIIEKHLALANDAGGLDDPIALTEEDFRLLCRAVRRAEEHGPQRTLRDLEKTYGPDRVEAVLGSGRKRLAASEAANYDTTRRSILTVSDIRTGETFSRKNTALLRSEKNLSPGLHPRYLSVILGRPARHDLPSGTGVRWEDI